jgi:hypothetical protein
MFSNLVLNYFTQACKIIIEIDRLCFCDHFGILFIFSDLKWIRYEFPKYWLFSGIDN